MEQKFSTEKHRFRSHSGRGHVGQMIRSRGQYILRLQYSSPDEIDSEQIIGNAEAHLNYLREKLHGNIKASCANFRQNLKIGEVYTQLLTRMYGLNATNLEKR